MHIPQTHSKPQVPTLLHTLLMRPGAIACISGRTMRDKKRMQCGHEKMLSLAQMNGKDFSWGSLNTLCWAIGSISGSMAEEQENRRARWRC